MAWQKAQENSSVQIPLKEQGKNVFPQNYFYKIDLIGVTAFYENTVK